MECFLPGISKHEDITFNLKFRVNISEISVVRSLCDVTLIILKLFYYSIACDSEVVTIEVQNRVFSLVRVVPNKQILTSWNTLIYLK